MPSVSAEDAPRLRPYMQLAEDLGSFAGQLTETGLEKVNISFEGHVATLNTRPLVCAAITGLLKPLLESVNMVNAPVIARERNIDVSETNNERSEDYDTLIRVTVTTARRTRPVSGPLFGGNRPRVVETQGLPLAAGPGQHLTYQIGKAVSRERGV